MRLAAAWSQPRVPDPEMRNGWESGAWRISLLAIRVQRQQQHERDRPGHTNAVSEDGNEVRGNVACGGVGIGIEDIV